MFAVQKKLLVVSEDPGFAGALLQSWQQTGSVPEFEVVKPSATGKWPVCSVAVLDGVELVSRLAGGTSLAIAVTSSEAMPELTGAAQRIVHLRRSPGWAEVAAALALESMLRVQATQQVEEMKSQLGGLERFSTLGRFFAGEQHDLANALTSVMGHTELLLTQGGISDDVRKKMGTVHAMSLRIHDVLQRLSALDRELQLAARRAAQD
jgi:signal transduction histidine kinase